MQRREGSNSQPASPEGLGSLLHPSQPSLPTGTEMKIHSKRSLQGPESGSGFLSERTFLLLALCQGRTQTLAGKVRAVRRVLGGQVTEQTGAAVMSQSASHRGTSVSLRRMTGHEWDPPLPSGSALVSLPRLALLIYQPLSLPLSPSATP